jgi:hypothetical protein
MAPRPPLQRLALVRGEGDVDRGSSDSGHELPPMLADNTEERAPETKIPDQRTFLSGTT